MKPFICCIIAISAMFLASLPAAGAVIYDEGSSGDVPDLIPGLHLGPFPHDGVPGGIFTAQGTIQGPGDPRDVYVFDIPAGSQIAEITVQIQLLAHDSSLYVDLLAGGSLTHIYTTQIQQGFDPPPYSVGQASMFPLPPDTYGIALASDTIQYWLNVVVTPVPEPTTMILMAAGLPLLLKRRRSRS